MSVETSDLNNSDFDMSKYQEYIETDYREEQLKKLIENQKLLKSIKYENIDILKSLSNPEKNEKIVNLVKDVWGGVLESNVGDLSVLDVVDSVLIDQDDLELFYESRNKNHFKGNVVFDSYKDHPVQKRLVRNKHLSKRDVNSRRTPMQTINCVYDAKQKSELNERLEAVEQSLDDMKPLVEKLIQDQKDMKSKLNDLSEVANVRDMTLLVLEQELNHPKKFMFYKLYTAPCKTTLQQIADVMGVSLKTTKNYLRDLRNRGYIKSK